jgi:hypothetical protein
MSQQHVNPCAQPPRYQTTNFSAQVEIITRGRISCVTHHGMQAHEHCRTTGCTAGTLLYPISGDYMYNTIASVYHRKTDSTL